MDNVNGQDNRRELWRRNAERAGPALKESVQVPRSLLKNPIDEPERYAEIVKPLWDSTVELVEKDYLAALRLLERLEKVRMPSAEEIDDLHTLDLEFCAAYVAALRYERAKHTPETTLFEALGLRLVFSTDRHAWRGEEAGLAYRWKADLYPPSECSAVREEIAEVKANSIIYWPETRRQFKATGTYEPYGPWQWRVPFGMTGSATFAGAEEDVAACTAKIRTEGGQVSPLDKLELRIAVVEAVIKRYELDGRVERYDEAATRPPEVSHAFKLTESADYCVERACTLIRKHRFTISAAHARLMEEVKGDYPEKSPYFPQPESLKDAFKTRGIRVSDLKGENGGNEDPLLSP